MSFLKQKFLPVVMLVSLSPLAHSADLSTDQQKFSYVVGFQFAQQLKAQGIEVDMASYNAAVEDVFKGRDPQMTLDEMNAALAAGRTALLQKKEAQAKERLAAGQAFLEKNKDKEGVEVLPSGLQYKVLQAGEGESPSAEATVTVHYRGTLIDGKEFDSSYKRGQPTSFGLGGVIPGFRESLTRMNKGAKWQVFVPAELGYGAKGAGASIGPNEALIFEIELISFK